MLLWSEFRKMEALVEEGIDLSDQESWRMVGRLSGAWRKPWVQMDKPVALPDTPTELAILELEGHPVCVMATGNGQLGIGALTEQSVALSHEMHSLSGFDPKTDQIRNIIAAPRRLSTETDLFITVRRWSQDSAPPRPLLWRAVCWWDGDLGPTIRPVVERVPAGELPWAPINLPPDAKQALPGWVHDVPYQAALPDPLAPASIDSVTRLLDAVETPLAVAACPGGLAWAGLDRVVRWRMEDAADDEDDDGLQLEQEPVALTLVRDERGQVQLVVGCGDGLVIGPVVPGASGPAPRLELGATPTVIGALPTGQHLDLVVAGQDRHLTRWRWVGAERLRGLWLGVVAQLGSALPGPEGWETWCAGDIHAAPDEDARHLLWLHAAWRDPSLMEAFCAAVGQGRRRRRGTRVGQELAAILQTETDPAARARGLQVYTAGGLALREQVDRARLTQVDDALSARSVRNYWDNARSQDPRERAAAIGNLSTRSYVHEATWDVSGRWVGVVCRGSSRHAVVADSTGLKSIGIPTGGIEADTRKEDQPFVVVEGAALGDASSAGTSLRWRWARSLHQGQDRFGVVFGGDRGICTLICPDGDRVRAESLDGDPTHRCMAATNLAPPADDQLRLGIMWAEGPRTVLDVVPVKLRPGGVSVTMEARIPVPVPATRADIAWLGGGLVLAAATPTRSLEFLRLDDRCTPWYSLELDSAAVELRFATGGTDDAAQPLLLVGTQGGKVWCLDVARRVPEWVYDAQGAVTCIDVVGRGPDLQVAVSAAPDRLTILDAAGRRRWRHRIGRRPRDLSLVPPQDGRPGRLIVLDDQGKASIYRQPLADLWQARAVELPEALADHDRVIAARAIRSGRFLESAEKMQEQEARRALLAASVGSARVTETELAALLALPGVVAGDIAAMARELSCKTPLSHWEVLWDCALERLRRGHDDGRAGHDMAGNDSAGNGEMVGELLGHLRRRGAALSYVKDRLDELSAPDIRGGGFDLGDHPWAAMLAAQTWLAALDDGADTQPERLIQSLHQLPPAAAQYLPFFLSSPGLGALVKALLAAAVGGSDQPPSLQLREAAERLAADGNTLRALSVAVALVQQPTWSLAEALLRAGQDLSAAASPLSSVLRQPAVQAPSGDLPDDTWRLDRQARWLTEALGRRLASPQAPSSGHQQWTDLAGWLLGQIQQAYHKALLSRLTEVVARIRPRLSARVLRWTGDIVLLGFDLAHEGPLPVDDARIEVDLSPDGGGDLVGDPWAWSGKCLAPGDPPQRGRMSVRVPPSVSQLTVQVRLHAGGLPVDRTDWPVKVGEPAPEHAASNLLLETPALWQACSDQVDALDRGVAVLVLDAVLDPKAVVDKLMNLPATDRVDLDTMLAEVGPGRRYEAGLTATAVLRVIGGHEARDGSADLGPDTLPRSGDGPGRVILSPCAESAGRILELPEVWGQLRDMMQAYAKTQRAPALVVVLPAGLGARKFAELAESGAKLIHPARVPSALWRDDDLLRAVAKRLRKDTSSARALVAEAGGDLRVIEDRLSQRPDSTLSWLRADLAGVTPSELTALIALSGARARLPVAELRAGMVAAEDVRTSPRKPGRQAKVLAQEGRTVINPRRLASVRRELLVRGVVADELKDIPEEERTLLHLVGFSKAMKRRLEHLGLLESGAGVATLRSDLDRILGGLRSEEGLTLQDCIQRLGDEDTWWSAICIEDLVHIDASDLEPYRPGDAAQALVLFRNLGRLWREPVADHSVCKNLVEAWVGAPPQATYSHKPVGNGEKGAASPPTATTATTGLHELPKISTVSFHFVPRGAQAPEPATGSLDIYLGPGVEQDRALVGVRVGDRQVRAILRSPDLKAGFWTCVRAQCGLELLSPFTHTGALPVGSPLFVGRTHIRDAVQANLLRRSFLILGARQLGKTSLLHQLYHEALARQDVEPFLVDAQGRDTPELLLPPLQRELETRGLSTQVDDADAALDRLQDHAWDSNRKPVLFLNEIDGLLTHTPQFLQRLRARHEAEKMGFVFVGYATARWALDDGNSPLYHFTEALRGRAFYLGPLVAEGSRELLSWLVRPPLSFQWVDDQHRLLGESLLMDHAYHIPWVLQDLCQAVVQDLSERGVNLIRVDDVRRVLAARKPFLQHLDEFDLPAAMGRRGTPGENLAREGGRLMLLLLAARTYFANGQRTTVEELLAQSPQSVAFRTDEVLDLCEQGLSAIPLLDDERATVEQWLRGVPIDPFFQALSLSLLLAPTRDESGQAAWYFQSHIYPAELRRAEAQGRSFEDRLHDQAQRLVYHLRT